MRVLIACEESQEVCKAFRARGHEAYSCDIQECSGGHPEWHISGDVLTILNPTTNKLSNNIFSHGIAFSTSDGKHHFIERGWDMIIAHPPCTYLTVTGNSWFNIEKYGEKALQRHKNRDEAINFFKQFILAKCDKIAVENPVGVMSTHYRKPDQIVQPWMFGDEFEKRTCLWLIGLKPLKPSKIVKPPERIKCKNGHTMPKWYADAWSLPPKERAKFRSRTFPGIAAAMAEQWE